MKHEMDTVVFSQVHRSRTPKVGKIIAQNTKIQPKRLFFYILSWGSDISIKVMGLDYEYSIGYLKKT